MPHESDRIQLLQGTLDMLILRTLLFGPAHGHEIAKHIQRTREDLLQVEHGKKQLVGGIEVEETHRGRGAHHVACPGGLK
jgi:hypothetical protein